MGRRFWYDSSVSAHFFASFDKFPTKLINNNDAKEIFDVDLKNKEEQILYYQSILEKQETTKDKEYILGILNDIINGEDDE